MKKLLTALCCMMLGMGFTLAGTVPLSWSAVTSPSMIGYRIYWGTSATALTNQVDVGLATSYELPGLPDCTDLFIAVKARTADKVSANFSNVVTGYSRVVITPVTPNEVEIGPVYHATVLGVNFKSGAIVHMDLGSTRIIGTNTVVVNCNKVTFDIATAGKPAGSYSVTVENLDGTYGTLAADIIVVSPIPPDVPLLTRPDDLTP